MNCRVTMTIVVKLLPLRVGICLLEVTKSKVLMLSNINNKNNSNAKLFKREKFLLQEFWRVNRKNRLFHLSSSKCIQVVNLVIKFSLQTNPNDISLALTVYLKIFKLFLQYISLYNVLFCIWIQRRKQCNVITDFSHIGI